MLRRIRNVIYGYRICKRFKVKFNIFESLYGNVLGCNYRKDGSITVSSSSCDIFIPILFHEIGHGFNSPDYNVEGEDLCYIHVFASNRKKRVSSYQLVIEAEASRRAVWMMKLLKIHDERYEDFLAAAYSTYTQLYNDDCYKTQLALRDIDYRGIQYIKGNITFKEFLGDSK